MDVYLDNAATTQIDKQSLKCLIETYNMYYGNPSSLHKLGYECEKIFIKSLKSISRLIDTELDKIIITSGGTESNNTALNQIEGLKRKKILTSRLEHPSVLKYCEYLKKSYKIEYDYYETDDKGKINLNSIKEKISKEVGMITIPFVNSEVGLIQDIKNISREIKKIDSNILIHVDAVQAFGKIKVNVCEIDIDYMSFSSHKIHGPKGIGGLYIRNPGKFRPVFYGGGQQKNLRPGTENIPSTVAFGSTCDIAYSTIDEEYKRIESINKKYRKLLDKKIDNLKFNSKFEDSSPYILNFSIKDIKSEVLIHFLEMEGIFISSGTACSSNYKNVSEAYKELEIGKEYIDGTIRISFGRLSSIDDVEEVVEKISKYVDDIREMVRR